MTKKIAVVTGATKGIGKAISERLVSDGYLVIGTYVSNYDAYTIRNMENENFKLKQVDSSQHDAVQAFAKDIKSTYGNINVLVNNAGVVRDNLLMMMKESEFDTVIDVNLKGAFNMTKAFTRQLFRSEDASVINIASVIGVMGNVGQSNYAASKAGLIGFSKSLAKEFASRHVRVNVVAPGFIQTDMTEALEDSLKETILNNIPLMKLGEAKDVADAVSYLAQAKYVTGQTLSVCGGLLI
ncbi:MAG TPA: 3-oxoacyl-ACP reductase FabG [Erysipelothrix sp.]|nr:3-oxoacyl-ACP reductase FabG [Erysipelothrix sp.]